MQRDIIALSFFHALNLAFAGELKLVGESSQIRFETGVIGSNDAILHASCGGGEPSFTVVHPRSVDTYDGSETDLWVQLKGVKATCVEADINEPCAPHHENYPALFYCGYTGDRGQVFTGPWKASREVDAVGSTDLAINVFLKCRLPSLQALEGIITPPWSSDSGTQDVTLSITYAAPPLHSDAISITYAGSPKANIVKFPNFPAPPPSHPPSSPPPPPSHPPPLPPPPLPPPSPPSPPPPWVLRIEGAEEKMFDSQKLFVFSSSGTLEINSDEQFTNILLVGGGGGCGHSNYHSGGGGAGGLVFGENFVLPKGKYDIVVGAGGSGSAQMNVYPLAGGSSYIANQDTGMKILVAEGGGRTNDYSKDCCGGSMPPAGSGGSGAGAGGSGLWNNGGSSTGAAGASTQNTYSSLPNVVGYGNRGGYGVENSYCTWCAGGGGGAGDVGGTSTTSRAGNGGDGRNYGGIFGTDLGDSGWFAGGGGGSAENTKLPGLGGRGGGGDGSYWSGTDGKPNTGGGCGASERGVYEPGKSGGSGIVIFKMIPRA